MKKFTNCVRRVAITLSVGAFAFGSSTFAMNLGSDFPFHNETKKMFGDRFFANGAALPGFTREGVPTGLKMMENLFSDLDKIHKNAPAIGWLKHQGIFNGYPDGSFQPDKTINRAELLKILVKGNDINPPKVRRKCFPDVDINVWFAPYVCYAKSEGWVSGYPDGNFRPGNIVNKAEALKMMSGSSSQSVRAPLAGEDWFVPFFETFSSNNWLNDNVNPAGNYSRGNTAEALFRSKISKQFGSKKFKNEYYERADKESFPDNNEGSSSSTDSGIISEVIAKVNEVRLAHGVSVLSSQPLLHQSAQAHAEDMARNDYFSHTEKNGSSFGDRIKATGYQSLCSSENIAYGQNTAQGVMDSWMKSPGHKTNILREKSREIGIGLAWSDEGTSYWVQNFGCGKK